MIIISKIQEIKSTGVVSIKFLPDGLYLDFDSDKFIYLTDSKLDTFAILTKNRPQSKTYKLTIPYLEYNEYTQSVQLHYYSIGLVFNF
jgi:hypothetical protein